MKSSVRLPSLLALLALVLAGCAALPPVDEGAGRSAEDVEHFLLEGKVAWRHPEERGNANLSWTQRGEDYHLLLSGPLGQGAVTVERLGQGVRVSSRQGEHFAESPDALLQEALGFSVPVDEARWWVLGLPSPGGGVARPGAERLREQGWEVRWSDWRQVDEYAVPRRVELERDELLLTFVITAWQLEPAEG